MTAMPPTSADKKRWSAIVEMGCIIGIVFGFHHCTGRATIHHCGTGAGGRKKHWFTICLCWGHHQGKDGIDGGHLSKREWQEKWATEQLLYDTTEKLFTERGYYA